MSSPSSEGARLAVRLAVREPATEEAPDWILVRALRDMVLWLSRACLRRSRMVARVSAIGVEFADYVGIGAVDSTLGELAVGRLDYAGGRR